MIRIVATRSAEGKLVLDAQLRRALELPAEGQVDFIVGDNGISIRTSASEHSAAPIDLHDLQKREARVRALAGSLRSEVDLVAELQAERRRESW